MGKATGMTTSGAIGLSVCFVGEKSAPIRLRPRTRALRGTDRSRRRGVDRLSGHYRCLSPAGEPYRLGKCGRQRRCSPARRGVRDGRVTASLRPARAGAPSGAHGEGSWSELPDDVGGRGHAQYPDALPQPHPHKAQAWASRARVSATRSRPFWDRMDALPGTHSQSTLWSSRPLHWGTRSARPGSRTVRRCTGRVNPYVHDSQWKKETPVRSGPDGGPPETDRGSGPPKAQSNRLSGHYRCPFPEPVRCAETTHQSTLGPREAGGAAAVAQNDSPRPHPPRRCRVWRINPCCDAASVPLRMSMHRSPKKRVVIQWRRPGIKSMRRSSSGDPCPARIPMSRRHPPSSTMRAFLKRCRNRGCVSRAGDGSRTAQLAEIRPAPLGIATASSAPRPMPSPRRARNGYSRSDRTVARFRAGPERRRPLSGPSVALGSVATAPAIAHRDDSVSHLPPSVNRTVLGTQSPAIRKAHRRTDTRAPGSLEPERPTTHAHRCRGSVRSETLGVPARDAGSTLSAAGRR
jgi:hypothetical protein